MTTTADCASGARLREQVATLAHAAAGLREDAARARGSERVTTASCVSALGQTRRLWLRRERLARWAGVVAADTRENATEAAMLECLNLTGAELERVESAHRMVCSGAWIALDQHARVVAERDALRAAYNDAVRDLARSWRSA